MTRHLIACAVLALLPAAVAAQRLPAAASLSLDAAIDTAVANNRQLLAARLNVDKADADLAVARTRRLPAFEAQATASQLLSPVEFAFPAGAFGTFPATGPIPSTDTTVTLARRPTLYFSSQVAQPLTQLVRIGLGIRAAATGRDLEREKTRAQQLALVNAVKRQYFAILQTQSALEARAEAIALYRELDRTLAVRLAQKVALRGDALDVQFRLAQEELAATTSRNALATQKEQLNQLLGRDVGTPFEIEPAAAISLFDVDVEAAQRRALAARPDVIQARLTLERAELDRRITRAERIPDVSLALSYTSNLNVDVLPRHMAAAGVKVTWEPFDWGRRNHEAAAKAHTVVQARLALRDAEDKAVLDVNSRFRTLAEKRALLLVAQMAQATSREKLRVKTNHFQIEAALLPDVLQLRADLAAKDDGYQQALVAFWTAKADFDLAVGEDVIP
jgi:outer membrane protein TolC